MAGRAASFCRACDRCCALVAEALLSLARSMHSTARSLSVSGSSTAVLMVKAWAAVRGICRSEAASREG